ncbi:hypothetical protein ABVT39_011161 [Epinephelus coioides]
MPQVIRIAEVEETNKKQRIHRGSVSLAATQQSHVNRPPATCPKLPGNLSQQRSIGSRCFLGVGQTLHSHHSQRICGDTPHNASNFSQHVAPVSTPVDDMDRHTTTPGCTHSDNVLHSPHT